MMRIIAGSLLILAIVQTSFAQEFIVAPYLLAPNMTGNVTVDNHSAEVDVGPGEIFENLDVGAILNSIESGLYVPAGATMALQEIDVSGSQTWFDPLIAARLTVPTENNWLLGIAGDVGGFGVGSDYAWQVLPFVGYRFSKLFELAAAYRALDMKYENGSGPNLFIDDMVIFGPEVGLLFHL